MVRCPLGGKPGEERLLEKNVGGTAEMTSGRVGWVTGAGVKLFTMLQS